MLSLFRAVVKFFHEAFLPVTEQNSNQAMRGHKMHPNIHFDITDAF